MSEPMIEIKDSITTVQKRELMKVTSVMKDVINEDEFKGIMLIYQRAIKRTEKESGQEI